MGNLSPSGQSSAQDAKLLSAIEEANLERLQKAMRKGANIRSCVYPGLHPTRQSRIPTVAPQTPPLWSALMRASYHGHNHIVQILLQQGVDIGLQAWDGTTALMLAAQEGHLHVVQELCKAVKHPILQPGVASKQIPPQPPPPQQLGAAEASAAGAMEESPQIVPRSASSFHPVLDAIDDKGQTALLRAAALGHGTCMETLLIAGANVCIADRMDGMTALAWAAEHGPSRLVLLCIQAGSNINRKNHNGQTPLLCAASKDYDYSGDHQQLGVGVEDRPHLLSLDETRRLGSGESIEESKSMSHAVSSASAGGGARFASSASPSSIVLTLLQNGGDANAANHDKVTALMVAAWKGHSAVVDLLIAHRANLNARAERGQTALMLAAAQAHSRCAETLITAGALLDVVDEKGQTALHKAAVRGDTHTAECLVRAGADVRLAESVHGNTALQLAAQNLHSSIVELLLRGGRGGNRADPCVRNHRGESALMLAAARGHSYTVACLLKGGAAPDLAAADDAGNSVLMLAARAGSEPVVELLLDCASVVGPGLPALLAARNHADECALDLALQQRHAPVVELLIAAGSDAHLLVPSSNGSAGGATHIFSMLLQHASLKEAVDRGLAMRDRFETREKRYKDVVASLEQQQQQLRIQSMQDAAASSSSAASLDGIELQLDHQNGGPNSPGGRRQTPSGSGQRSNAVDGSSIPTPIRSVSGDNPSAASSARRTQPTLLTRHSSDLSNDSSSSPAGAGAGAVSAASAAASPAIPSSLSSRPILEWSVPQVLLWLQSLSLSSYTQSFSDAAIDGEMLLEFLRNEDLLESELGITRKIHRIKILREIKKMVPNSNGGGGGNGNGNTNGTNGATAAAAPAAADGTINGSGPAARPSSHSVASDSKDAAAAHDPAAASGASVPLTTSISNPLPAPNGSGANGSSNGVATTARFQQQQQQQQQQPPSSARLFPAPAASSPALSSSSAALFPASAVGSAASSSAASASPAAAAAAAKPAPKILTSAGTPSIFSAGFDFDNLAGLAPLSATSAASSGPSSNASSAAPTPSGSGDKMPTMAEQPRIGGQQNSLSSGSSSSNQQSPQPLMQPQQPQPHAHHLQVHRPAPMIAQEYSPMHQTDLLMEPAAANGINGHALSAPATGSIIHGSDPDHPSDPLKSTPAPSPSSSSSPALRPHPPHHSPRRIPYSELVLKEIIGQGQFGTVWLGSWRGAAVAVKKLHLAASVLAVSAASGASGNSGASNSGKHLHGGKDGSGSGGSNIAAEQMALFLQEASLMEQLGNHPNLISFVGISLPDTAIAAPASASACAVSPSALSSDEPTQGDVCIVTQYFPLGSIRDLLITKRTLGKIPPSVLAAAVTAGAGQADAASAPPSPLPLLTLLRMLRDISCGVLHLHLEHCIHRDLAARNFLVDEYSLSVRVADFGMSRFLQAAQQTAPNTVNGGGAGAASLHSAFTHSQVGPLKWMSPESILRHEYSSASDAYSFGIACWELIAQSEPYPEQLALEAAIRAAHEPSFRPTMPNYVPKPLAQLMQQCWAHAPKERPTFAHILAQLERMEAHLKAKLKSNPTVSPWAEECWNDYETQAQVAAS